MNFLIIVDDSFSDQALRMVEEDRKSQFSRQGVSFDQVLMTSSNSSTGIKKKRRFSLESTSILSVQERNLIYDTVRFACLQLGEMMRDAFAQIEIKNFARRVSEDSNTNLTAIQIAEYLTELVSDPNGVDELHNLIDRIIPDDAPLNMDLVQLATSMRYSKTLKNKGGRKLVLDVMNYDDRKICKRVQLKALIDSARKMAGLSDDDASESDPNLLDEPDLDDAEVCEDAKRNKQRKSKIAKKREALKNKKDGDVQSQKKSVQGDGDDSDEKGDDGEGGDDGNKTALSVTQTRQLLRSIAELAPKCSIAIITKAANGDADINASSSSHAAASAADEDATTGTVAPPLTTLTDRELYRALLDKSPYFCQTTSSCGIVVQMELPGQTRFRISIMTRLRELSDSMRRTEYITPLAFAEGIRKLVATMLTFRVHFNHDDSLYAATPPTGFCCFLAHLQYIEYWKRQDWDNWVAFKHDFAYSEEFANQVQADIAHWQEVKANLNSKKVDALSRNVKLDAHPLADEIDDILTKLEKLYAFIRTQGNQEKKSNYPKKDNRWGSNWQQGLFFVHRLEVPVLVCEHIAEEPGRAILTTFYPRTANTMRKNEPENIMNKGMTMRELKSLFESIGNAKFGIMFDIPGEHYYGIKLPNNFASVVFESIEHIANNLVQLVARTDFNEDDVAAIVNINSSSDEISVCDLVSPRKEKKQFEPLASSSSNDMDQRVKGKRSSGYTVSKEAYFRLCEYRKQILQSQKSRNNTSRNHSQPPRGGKRGAPSSPTFILADEDNLIDLLNAIIDEAQLLVEEVIPAEVDIDGGKASYN